MSLTDGPVTQVWGGGPTALQGVLWVGLAAAIASARVVVRAARLPSRVWLGIGIVALGALAARLLGAPATILHDNSHAYVEIGLARSLIVDGTHFYGNGWFTFWYHLFRLFPAADGVALLHANALLDAGTVALVGVLAALLSRRATAAVLAAGLYAVLPVAVKAGHTESFLVLGAFLECLGFVLAAVAIREARAACAVAGGLVLGFAAHVRPELAVLPVLTVLLALSVADRPSHLWRRPHGALVLAVQAVVSWPAMGAAWRHMVEGSGAAEMLDYGIANLGGLFLGIAPEGAAGNVFLSPTFTPPPFPLLFALGIVAAVRMRARWSIFPALAPIVLLGVVLPIQNAPWVSMRLQHGALWLFCLLPAAALVSRPWRWLTPGRGAALAAVACLSAVPYAGLVIEKRAPQEEFDFLRTSVPGLPDGCAILHAGSEREIVADLPTWLSRDAGRRHEWIPVDERGEAASVPAGSCVLWYRGIACYAMPAAGYGAPVGGLRPGCAAFERARGLEPAATARVSGESDTFYRFSRERLEIGFFRVAAGGDNPTAERP